MTTQTKHTKLPWAGNFGTRGGSIYPDNIHSSKLTMEIRFTNADYHGSNEEQVANAEFIVKACNNHYQLLEACKSLLSILETLDASCSMADVEKIFKAKKAINQAEGK